MFLLHFFLTWVRFSFLNCVLFGWDILVFLSFPLMFLLFYQFCFMTCSQVCQFVICFYFFICLSIFLLFVFLGGISFFLWDKLMFWVFIFLVRWHFFIVVHQQWYMELEEIRKRLIITQEVLRMWVGSGLGQIALWWWWWLMARQGNQWAICWPIGELGSAWLHHPFEFLVTDCLLCQQQNNRPNGPIQSNPGGNKMRWSNLILFCLSWCNKNLLSSDHCLSLFGQQSALDSGSRAKCGCGRNSLVSIRVLPPLLELINWSLLLK